MNSKTIPINNKNKDYLRAITILLDSRESNQFKRRWYSHNLKEFWEPGSVSLNKVIKELKGDIEYVCYDVERTLYKKYKPEFFDILP